MLETILKYGSLIAMAGAAISFLVGWIKYVDQRRREQSAKEFEAFHIMVSRAAGEREGGGAVPLTQQLAAIYQLQKYKEYSYASIPVLSFIRESVANQADPRVKWLLSAIDETVKELHENARGDHPAR